MPKTDIYFLDTSLTVYHSLPSPILNIYLYISYEELSRVLSKLNEIGFAEDSMKKKQ